MKSPYFPSLVLLTLALNNEIELSFSERRISQEEWHQFRFGGMAMGSDPNQWTYPRLQQMEMPQVIQAPAPNQMDSTLETNVHDIEVGKDKLVLVNDQGSIKMLRASQLPTVSKQNTEVTTQTPSTVIQMPLDQYLTKDSNTNPTKNPNQIEIISPNFGAGHRVAGLPVAFASSSNQPDRPNVVYQTENNPCVKASDNPPIYIPAPQVSATTSRSSDNRKLVRIIIEMPESMTRNIDEASRYAATQVQRLKVSEGSSPTSSAGAKPKRKIKKNIHEVIRKVVETEEDNEESEEEPINISEGSAIDEDMEEASHQSNTNNVMIAENADNNTGKKYIFVRKSGRLRGKGGKRQEGNLKAIDKYKKIIKVYRD